MISLILIVDVEAVLATKEADLVTVMGADHMIETAVKGIVVIGTAGIATTEINEGLYTRALSIY
jgi:hypothetical protein